MLAHPVHRVDLYSSGFALDLPLGFDEAPQSMTAFVELLVETSVSFVMNLVAWLLAGVDDRHLCRHATWLQVSKEGREARSNAGSSLGGVPETGRLNGAYTSCSQSSLYQLRNQMG